MQNTWITKYGSIFISLASSFQEREDRILDMINATCCYTVTGRCYFQGLIKNKMKAWERISSLILSATKAVEASSHLSLV